MSYCASEKIIIFPCVSRSYTEGETNIKAKLMSEENITNIIKSITDKKSYVIKYDNDNKKFIFVLDGYYVELYDELKGTKYVSLNFAAPNGTHRIIQGDNNGNFDGLHIMNDLPGNVDYEYLCLCKDGDVPAESYYKFDTKSMQFDFGELK